MHIIHGVYHFWPKRVGFRNDYCLGCQKPRRSVAMRTFDVGHLFWIPLVPVGFWKHWKCSECGRDPHVSTKTGRPLLWAGLACLVILSWVVWSVPGEPGMASIPILRLLFPAGAVAVFLRLVLVPKEPTLKERLATISPAADEVCPFCVIRLLPDSSGKWACPACGTVRL
jgi:hypothetical protein